MAGLKEYNSFVGKFFHLWQSGIEANLNIRSKAGEAFINLEAGLGKAQPMPHQQQEPPYQQPKPSRLRRTHQRAEARSRQAEQAVKETKTSEEETLGKGAENVSTVNQNEAKIGDKVEKDREIVDQKDTSGEVEKVEPCES